MRTIESNGTAFRYRTLKSPKIAREKNPKRRNYLWPASCLILLYQGTSDRTIRTKKTTNHLLQTTSQSFIHHTQNKTTSVFLTSKLLIAKQLHQKNFHRRLKTQNTRKRKRQGRSEVDFAHTIYYNFLLRTIPTSQHPNFLLRINTQNILTKYTE